MVLSTGDLTRMRATARKLMPDTCTIQTASTATSTYGGAVRTWSNTYTAVPCRVARLGEQVRVQARAYGTQPVEVSDWMVTLPYDQTIALGNRIVLSNMTLEIIDINTDKSWKTGTRVLCGEVRTG